GSRCLCGDRDPARRGGRRGPVPGKRSRWLFFLGATRARSALDAQGLVDRLLKALELVRGAAQDGETDETVAVDDERRREPLVAPERLRQVVVAEELTVGHAVLADEVLDLLGLAGVEDDPDDLDAAGAVSLRELDVFRQLGQAGAAPGGPEVEHHHLALHGSQGGAPTVEVGEVERRGGPHGGRGGRPAGRERQQGRAEGEDDPARRHPTIIARRRGRTTHGAGRPWASRRSMT